MVLIVGAVVTIVYLLLGLYVVRQYALGASSAMLNGLQKPVFTFLVPVAVVFTNVLIIAILDSSKLWTSDFLYINVLPLTTLTYHALGVYRLHGYRNQYQDREERAMKNINEWIDYVQHAVPGITIKPYVYLSHGHLRGKILVVVDESELSFLKSAEKMLPPGVTMEVIFGPNN